MASRKKPEPNPTPLLRDVGAEAADNRLLVSAMLLQALIPSGRMGDGELLTPFGRQTVRHALLLADELIVEHHATLPPLVRPAPEAGR